MIELYYWPTPNGHKITIFLEETGLPYTIRPVDIGKGEQFTEAFLAISPNNKMPAIIDRAPADGGEPLSMFESGAILEYLAQKSGRLLPADPRQRFEILPWLYWQVGHLGPMLGQHHHFSRYAPEKLEYAIERYQKEAERLYGVLDDRLENRDYIADDYSIADIASYPWVLPESQNIDMAEYPHLARWRQRIAERPAVQRAYQVADAVKSGEVVTEESRNILFGQGRRRRGA
jgi:GST-like protein